MPSTRRATTASRKLSTLRKRSNQITHNIVQLEAKCAEMNEQILRLEGQLKIEHASAKLCRGKATARAFARARKWATEQQTNAYITILALKQKSGKNSYEYAFFEPQNRGEAMCGRGAVDNPMSDAITATAFSRTEGTDYTQFHQQLLKLFPTNRKTAAAFTRQYNASLKNAGDDAPDLDAAIAYLIRGAGFIEV